MIVYGRITNTIKTIQSTLDKNETILILNILNKPYQEWVGSRFSNWYYYFWNPKHIFS